MVPPESDNNLRLEIGHVLFIDIVGYSKLLNEEQKERLNQLTEIVLATAPVREATDEQLVRLPTGDGMALVFRRSAEEPARCALEIAEALQKHPELPVRMGILSGPVTEVTDVSGRTNIAGVGIKLHRQLHGDTTPRIEAGCDLLRTVRARDCDCVHPVRAPDPEIRPAYPSRQQPRLHRRTDTEDKNLL